MSWFLDNPWVLHKQTYLRNHPEPVRLDPSSINSVSLDEFVSVSPSSYFLNVTSIIYRKKGFIHIEGGFDSKISFG